MTLEVKPSIAGKLPTIVKSALTKMTTEGQMMFQEEFQKKAKSTGLMVALAIFFPIQLFLLGKTGLGLVFLLTWGGVGVWWVVEWFLTPKRVLDYNADIATKIMTDIKIMNQ